MGARPDRRVHRSWRRTAAATVVALLCAAVLAPPAAEASPDGATAPVSGSAASVVVGGLGYVALTTPCRAVDTRLAGGQFTPEQLRAFQIAGLGNLSTQGGAAGGCGIPDGAGAVQATFTVTGPIGNGYLRAFPKEDPPVVPNATLLNYTSGRSISNSVKVPLRTAVGVEDLYVKNVGGTTHVVVDILGYFVAAGGNDYLPLTTPCRAVNTVVTAEGTVKAGSTRRFRIAGSGLTAQGGPSAGCIPAGAVAAEVSVTVVSPTANGYLQVGPNDTVAPSTFLNYSSGVSITNTGSVRLAGGPPNDLQVRNNLATSHVLVDVHGYYSSALGARYQTVTPCRVLNTLAVGGPSGTGGRLAANVARTFQVAGDRVGFASQGGSDARGCAVPQAVAAVEAAITAVQPTGSGYARPFPLGTSPAATFLNYSAGIGITNAGAITLGRFGLDDLGIRNYSGTAHYVVDVLGYFERGPVEERAEMVSAGGLHTCATTAVVRRALCWGSNSEGQRGDGIGITTLPANAALRQVPGLSSVVQVASGGAGAVEPHTCVLRAVGQVSCFGANGSGQLGLNDTAPRTAPTAVPGLAGVVQIATFARHTCALTSVGTVQCWGRNDAGQLGTGDTLNRLVPTTVPGLAGVVQVTTGESHSCALLRDGTARCWGLNASGQLGDGTTTQRTSPTVVLGARGTPPLGGLVQVSAGKSVTCASLVDGTARCWGSSTKTGGIGTHLVGRPNVVGNGTNPLADVMRVSVGAFHACALLADGSARCWGNASNGELGYGAVSGLFQKPVTVSGLGPALPAVHLSAGLFHTCATLVDGTARCWGDNGAGQLGDGTTVKKLVPTPVLSIP